MTARFPAARTGPAMDDRTRSGVALSKTHKNYTTYSGKGEMDEQMAINRSLFFQFESKRARYRALKKQHSCINSQTRAFNTDSGYTQIESQHPGTRKAAHSSLTPELRGAGGHN